MQDYARLWSFLNLGNHVSVAMSSHCHLQFVYGHPRLTINSFRAFWNSMAERSWQSLRCTARVLAQVNSTMYAFPLLHFFTLQWTTAARSTVLVTPLHTTRRGTDIHSRFSNNPFSHLFQDLQISSDTLSFNSSWRKQVSLYRIFPVISTGEAGPSVSYTPFTTDSILLFVTASWSQ